jgi:hypothetical protein
LNPQEFLPLTKVALETHACRNPETRDDAPLNLLPGFSGSLARSPILSSGWIEMRSKPIVSDGR